MMRRQGKNRGFTLVELTLAMSFLSMLLLMITLLILQVSATFNKGFTLRSVNESGQLISSEIQRKLSTAPSETVGYKEGVADTVPGLTTNRFCVDGMVYAWTTLAQRDQNDPGNEKYVGFAKFSGPKKDYCGTTVNASYCGTTGAVTDSLKPVPSSGVTELIDVKDQALVIRSFSCKPITIAGSDGSQALYAVNFTIGTNTNDLIDTNGMCKPPENAKQEFCAVNDFSFIARSTKGVER